MAAASLSLSRWSMKIASDSSTVDLSTVPSNSPFFFSCHVERRRFTTSALHNSCFSSLTSNSGSRPSKWIDSDSRSSKQTTVVYNSKNDVTLVSEDGVRARKRQALSFKSLFGKRSLWRRILFASKKVRSVILLNAITVVYASNIPVLKEVEAIVDPSSFTVVRFAVSAIPFIPFVLRARADAHTRNAGFELGLWVSLGYLMQALGLETCDAGRASFISMFTVIVVPLLDGMLGAIVPARTWFGAVISILGVALLESSGSPPSVGDLLNFLSAVFFGVHMLRTEHISRSTNKKDLLPLLGYEVCIIALLSATWYFFGVWFGGIQGSDPSSWTWTMFWDWMVAFPWIPALYTGIFSTGVCLWIEAFWNIFLLFFLAMTLTSWKRYFVDWIDEAKPPKMAAMRDVSATETAIIYGLEPVWGAGFAWFLLGERWGAAGWLGAVLVLGGSLTVQIFGSLSQSNCSEDEKGCKKGDQQLGLNKQNGFSTAPVAVSSREDAPNLLKK